jgi:tetratricopeptide (TPR) repeat protein
MRTRVTLILLCLLLTAGAARAEEEWVRTEILRGIDLIFNADITGGEKVFRSIEEREPTNPAPYIYRAMALMSYPPREGMKGIDRALIERLLTTGIGYARAGTWADDEGRVNLLLATAYSLLAQLALEEKEYAGAARAGLKARDYLDEAARLSPDDPDVRYGLGILSYGMSEMPPFARSVLSLMNVPGDKARGLEDLKIAAERGVYTKASARVALLMILSNVEDRFPEAVAYGRELVARYPDNPELYFPYANALSETGDHEAALAVAGVLKRKIDEGLPYFDGAIVPRYHHLMGKILMDEGRFDEAAVELKQALVVNDTNYAWVRPLALARLGMIADATGKRKEAVDYYRAAVDTGVEGAGVGLAEKYLKNPYRRGGGK